MGGFAHLPSDIEIARVYRAGAIKKWMLGYFKFPESPEVISLATHQAIERSCHALIEIMSQVSKEVIAGNIELDGKSLLEWMDIPNHCTYWIKKFYQPDAKIFWGRPDFHIRDGKPWLLEANLASAAGYQQQVGGLFHYYAAHPEYFESFEDETYQIMDPLQALAAAFKQTVKPGQVVLIPDIHEPARHKDDAVVPYGGLISWFNLKTDMRFVSGFIHELTFADDGIYLGDLRVDHVFMSYYNPHVFDRFDEFLPIWDLFQAGKVNVIDSMNEVLWSNKLLMAFIDEQIDGLGLPADLTEVWKQTVPWTRILRRGKTIFNDTKIDIELFALKHKDQLVLKQAQSAEGKMVFVGKHVPQENWDETIKRVLGQANWIIQEFIEPDPVSMLLPEGDEYVDVHAMQTISPFLTGNKVAGYLNRYYAVDPEADRANAASITKLQPVGTTVIKLEKRQLS